MFCCFQSFTCGPYVYYKNDTVTIIQGDDDKPRHVLITLLIYQVFIRGGPSIGPVVHYYRAGLCSRPFIPVDFWPETIGGFCPRFNG